MPNPPPPPPPLTHLLTPAADLKDVRVVCGTATPDRATWLLDQVTCEPCKATRAPCTCRPGLDLCPTCRAWSRTHRADGSPRQTPLLPQVTSEKQFQEVVRREALAGQWLYYHAWKSVHSPEGFPDLVAVRGPTLLACELKMPGKRPTMAQQAWLEALAGVTQVQSHVWYPGDLETILEVFQC